MERATGQRDFGVQELPNRGTDLASGVVRGSFLAAAQRFRRVQRLYLCGYPLLQLL